MNYLNSVDLEALERSLGDSFDMCRLAVQTSPPLSCLRIEVEAELGGDHYLPLKGASASPTSSSLTNGP
jgi:hypothetical protein